MTVSLSARLSRKSSGPSDKATKRSAHFLNNASRMAESVINRVPAKRQITEDIASSSNGFAIHPVAHFLVTLIVRGNASMGVATDMNRAT
ncbi:hypothetical protein [Roseobacter sp. CCS2]|uniref:hypothetical protein n=1 Tax=Roseobacter sp. CCS2 TaxID=391593 RepID=UPI0018DCBAE4|nr:hypothetical protein [Roseobacter sp. CCS2]